MHKTVQAPLTKEQQYPHKFLLPHQPNPSGTSGAYVPYDTTKPKYATWAPVVGKIPTRT